MLKKIHTERRMQAAFGNCCKIMRGTSVSPHIFGKDLLDSRIKKFTCALLIFFSSANLTIPISDEIPVSVKIPIFLKVLSFDRQLQARSGTNLNMLILYQGRYKYSFLERDEIENTLDDLGINSIGGIPINFYYADID